MFAGKGVAMVWYVGFLALAAPAAAAAEPVYLTCEVAGERDRERYEITLREDQASAAVIGNDGRSRNFPAVFSRDRVQIDQPIGGDKITIAIDRTDLTARQTTTFSDYVRTGTCKLTPAPAKRAF
ncbi:hypothetical protein KZ820_14405 [Sphingomonas sp. RRHST34]|uniref:Uncharacterized protein n=2 Tax=Sphingomonas citri TaxID=2862499 RepID=A0ABS7BQQ7_9SPHN|nr:hypothetical protein [Sphingomonas citri]